MFSCIEVLNGGPQMWQRIMVRLHIPIPNKSNSTFNVAILTKQVYEAAKIYELGMFTA